MITASAGQLIGSIKMAELPGNSVFGRYRGSPVNGRRTKERQADHFDLIPRNHPPAEPGSLRVNVRLPVVGTTALDMATEGQTFTLWIPTRNEAFEGPNTVTKDSQNPLENLRPSVFSDTLLLSCVSPDDLVTLTSETKTQLDAKAKHLIAQPDYDLMVLRRKNNSQELVACRSEIVSTNASSWI